MGNEQPALTTVFNLPIPSVFVCLRDIQRIKLIPHSKHIDSKLANIIHENMFVFADYGRVISHFMYQLVIFMQFAIYFVI